MATFIGVDPGTAPNLALVSDDRGWMEVASRDRTSVKLSASKDEPVGALICAVMREWAMLYPIDGVVIEKIGPWTGQGLVSSANFVGAAKLVEGVAAGLGFPLVQYTPSQWKRGAGLVSKDKDYSRALALKLWPERAAWLRHKYNHNEAEAALLAWYHLQTVKKGAP